MVKIGLLEISDMSWDETKRSVTNLANEHGKRQANRKADHCEWYEIDKEGIPGRQIIGELYRIRFFIRDKVEKVDLLTNRVAQYYETNVRSLALIRSSFFDETVRIFLAVEYGTSLAIRQIAVRLGKKVSIRDRTSFSGDFLEYLNKANQQTPHYADIFGEDVESVGRKYRLMKHLIEERYKDISERDNNLTESFRESARLKVAIPTHLSEDLPTIEAVLYKENWVNIVNPQMKDNGIVFNEALIYLFKRLQEAYGAFQSISSGESH